MAKVTVETVNDVARLASLSLTEAERVTFARQLDQILAYAESVQAIDTEGVEPMSHAGVETPLRDDTPRDGLVRETVMEAAPDPAGPLFRVPRVLGG